MKKITKTLNKAILSEMNDIIAQRKTFTKKIDESLVSGGDLLVEKILINILTQKYPNHFILSEETVSSHKYQLSKGGNVITMDPIDGTENFVSGIPIWGTGISIYTNGIHMDSIMLFPELGISIDDSTQINKQRSRLVGLSSSLSADEIPAHLRSREIRILGCSMYNCYLAIKGSYNRFQNAKGVNTWDILPGLNNALKNGCNCFVDDNKYHGEFLPSSKKYKIIIDNGENDDLKI